jgi:hypothetical protein
MSRSDFDFDVISGPSIPRPAPAEPVSSQPPGAAAPAQPRQR